MDGLDLGQRQLHAAAKHISVLRLHNHPPIIDLPHIDCTGFKDIELLVQLFSNRWPRIAFGANQIYQSAGALDPSERFLCVKPCAGAPISIRRPNPLLASKPQSTRNAVDITSTTPTETVTMVGNVGPPTSCARRSCSAPLRRLSDWPR